MILAGVHYLIDRKPRRTTPVLLLLLGILANTVMVFRLGWGHVYWGVHRPYFQSLEVILVNFLIILLVFLISGPMRLPKPNRLTWTCLFLAVIIIPVLISKVVLAGYLYSADEYAYQFEALTFQQHRLWNLPPSLGQAQTPSYIWIVGSKWVAQYAPGWPIFLTLIGTLGLNYAWAPALLLAGTTYGVAALVRERANATDALISAMVFALSPFALYNAGSLLAHTISAFLAIMAMLVSRRQARSGTIVGFLAIGAIIGFLAITRNISAVVIASAILAEHICRGGRWVPRLLVIGIGGIPFICLLLLYQYVITGNAFMPVYWFGGRTVDHLYFDPNSIRTGLLTAGKNFVELTLYTNPIFLLTWALALFTLIHRKRLSAVDMIYPAGVLLFVFYPLDAGQRFGPRYNFDFWPTAVVTIGVALSEFRPLAQRFLRQALAFATITGFSVVIVIGALWHFLVIDTFDVFEVIKSAKINNAVVCLRSNSGQVYPLNPFNFPRNGTGSDVPVIKLRCEATSMKAIRQAYPTRNIWNYVRDVSQASGHLVLVDK